MGEVDRIPASVGQRLLWVLEQFRGQHGSTNCPVVLRLRGRLDLARLGDALAALTARHESLRTTLTGRGSRLTQVIHDPREVPLTRVDLGPDEPDDGLRAAISAEVDRPVDIATWPVRATLFRLADDDQVLCLNLHHAATDGGSCGLIVRDLAGLTGGTRLDPVRWQYADFCRWQQEWLGGTDAAEDREYWSAHLAGAALPRLPLHPGRAAWVSASTTATVTAATVSRLECVARSQHMSLASVLLGAYHLALHEATGDEDLVVATFLANRTRPELRDTVGLLANMAVVRTRVDPADLAATLRATHRTAMDGFVHQRLPYQLLPGDTLTAPDRRADDVMFQLVPPLPAGLRIAGTDAEVMVTDQLGSRFECEFQLYPQHGGLRIVLCYNASRLDAGTAERLVGTYRSITERIAASA